MYVCASSTRYHWWHSSVKLPHWFNPPPSLFWLVAAATPKQWPEGMKGWGLWFQWSRRVRTLPLFSHSIYTSLSPLYVSLLLLPSCVRATWCRCFVCVSLGVVGIILGWQQACCEVYATSVLVENTVSSVAGPRSNIVKCGRKIKLYILDNRTVVLRATLFTAIRVNHTTVSITILHAGLRCIFDTCYSLMCCHLF